MSGNDINPSTWEKRKEKWSANRARQDKAHQEVLRIVAALDESICRGAAASGVSEEGLREVIFGTQNLARFRRKRAPNLKNVAVHLTKVDLQAKGLEFDLHLAKPDWELCLAQLQEDADAAASGRDVLKARRDAETQQIRVSRKAREGDQTATTWALWQEAHAFNVRTRGHIFGFTVKGSPLDYGAAQFFGDDVGEAFLRQVLGKSGEELAKEFEIFAIHGS
ncbi:hypothetical protein DACRYDRAFT_23914 [Dacryopinax primogenitus]|uniref:Uncharacterized protein n=1 Tax=Dacryopinax primogenitus (strain DJM 731) TaxID=1858805 RepID=M5G6G5_DACPD|nr:uncharacterized protein DACRYDRAFT_23914 [Dacryopinax primogenitus]EJT99357.1 hypothetical protein DACRYDRAFT_23914 [Dacryopinax primogenitus]